MRLEQAKHQLMSMSISMVDGLGGGGRVRRLRGDSYMTLMLRDDNDDVLATFRVVLLWVVGRLDCSRDRRARSKCERGEAEIRGQGDSG